MSEDNQVNRSDSGRHLAFEADAVCVECGTVNPENTLLCKGCGNNLRDQREKRMAAAQAEGGRKEKPEGSGWLSKALVLLGILIVIWTTINISTVEEILIEAQGPGESPAHLFWTGEINSKYEELLRQLRMAPLTLEDIDRATNEDFGKGRFHGRYLIAREDESGGFRLLGQGIAVQDGDRMTFAAVLRTGAEIRGTAWVEGAGEPVARESAGVKLDNTYYVATGFLDPEGGGRFQCYGWTDQNEDSYRAVAFRVPPAE